MELDGGVTERHVPAWPNPGRESLGHPLGQAPEAQGSRGETQVKQPERGDQKDDEAKLHIESATKNAFE